jgi:hypothetical protein
MGKRKRTKKGSTNSASVEELCEIPDFLRKKPSRKRKQIEETPEEAWEAAKKRATAIAESCREISERTRLETNATQLEEYHKQKAFYDLVNDHMFSKEAKDSRIAGKVVAEEKRHFNVYLKCGVSPVDLALEILRWRLLESGKK